MAKFIASYDLHKVRDYSKLIELLKSWGACKALESTWLIDRASTAGQIRDALQGMVDSDDSLVVIELKPGSGWGTRNAAAAAKWLQTHIQA